MYKEKTVWIPLKQGILINAKNSRVFHYKISKWKKLTQMFGEEAFHKVILKLSKEK